MYMLYVNSKGRGYCLRQSLPPNPLIMFILVESFTTGLFNGKKRLKKSIELKCLECQAWCRKIFNFEMIHLELINQSANVRFEWKLEQFRCDLFLVDCNFSKWSAFTFNLHVFTAICDSFFWKVLILADAELPYREFSLHLIVSLSNFEHGRSLGKILGVHTHSCYPRWRTRNYFHDVFLRH